LSITPFAGGYLFEGNQNLRNKPVYGLALGYSLNPNWDFEAVYRWVPDSQYTSGQQQQLTIHGVSGDVLYNFSPERRFVPYVALGVGLLFLDPDNGAVNNDTMVNYGAGFKYYITDYFALRADVRHIFDITVHDTARENSFYNHFAYTAGVTFHIGMSPAAPPPLQAEKPLPVVKSPVPQAPKPALIPPSPQAPKLALIPPSPLATNSVLEPSPAKEEQAGSRREASAVVPGEIMVTGVEIRHNSLEIITDGRIRNFKSFTLTHPSRLVIDIRDAVNGLGAKKIPVNWSDITAVRFGSYPDHLRVVLDGAKSEVPSYRIEETGNGLKVGLAPPQKKK
jgi:outer membrane beta-barrel protein